MIKQILGIAIAISTLTATAQNEVDALRYSTQNLTGSARYSAMGGAFGSLGGEFSALSSNPAGIGMYQFTEFTFTPSFNVNSTKYAATPWHFLFNYIYFQKNLKCAIPQLQKSVIRLRTR